MHAGLWRQALVTAAAAAVFAGVASTATADQSFHTSHAALSPIGGAPLRSGFVNDIHTNGSTISAQERYQLNGAEPNTTYTVSLDISFADPTCTTPDLVFQTAELTTNASGNGEAGATFPQTGPWPPPKPPTLTTFYIRWVISSAAGPQYQTDCVPVTIDG